MAPDDPSVLIGHVIAERYRVDAVLGRGGMGAVLRCHHLGLRRDVAVKLLHPEIAADAEISARFEREATSASRLDHPNCVRVLDFGAWQPAPGAPVVKYLAMQLLEGKELASLLGQPLGAVRALALVRQILAALEHAHAQGIVHRDLKPENVFVTHDHSGAETLKLVDFGIAKITEGEGANAKLTRMGVVFGTPQYMSPEQAAGGVVDARSDLYSTGVILYEMLAGLPPFLGDDAMMLLRKHLFETPPPLPDSIPSAVRAVVMRLLDKDRDARYASATEVLAALDGADADAAASMVLPMGGTLREITMVPGRFSTSTARIATPSPAWMRPAIAAGLGVVVLGIIVAVATRDDDAATTEPAAVTTALPLAVATPPRSAAPAPLPAPPVLPGFLAIAQVPESRALADLDAMLVRGEHVAALAKVNTLLVETPDDPLLHLRRARALTSDPKRRAETLAAYRRALELDPALAQDRDTNARMHALLREPPMRTAAAELAIATLGADGLPLLVEFVQASTPVLPYDLRHRALVAIAANATLAASVDVSLQRSLDLWQAATTEAPCDRFAEALDAIAADPTAGVLGTLHRVTPPVAPEGADTDTQQKCAALSARLVVVRTEVLAAHPTPAASWTVPPAYAKPVKKKKRGVFGRMFGR